MKKFAVILASLTFFAGCARNDTDDFTEDTTTPPETGLGTPASSEYGMDQDTWSTTNDQSTMSTTNELGTTDELGTTPQGDTQTQPGATQPGLNDPNIEIIETNQLDEPSGADQGIQ